MAHQTSDDRNAHRPLGRLDMSKTIDKDEYETRLKAVQVRFMEIHQAYLHTGDAAVCVFEGWDAAGKGGTIRRMAGGDGPARLQGLADRRADARGPAPPLSLALLAAASGQGRNLRLRPLVVRRVLVERVEGFASLPNGAGPTTRSTGSRMLTDSGTRMTKVFLYITPDEQLSGSRTGWRTR